MTSEKWAGFTDEDIEQMKSNPRAIKSCRDKACEVDGYVSASKHRGPMKIKKTQSRSEKIEDPGESYEFNSINDLNKTKEMLLIAKKLPSDINPDEDFGMPEMEQNCTCDNYGFDEDESEIPLSENVQDIYHERNNSECEMDQPNENLLPLEVFELRQKRIEAENARRRTLISKAISDKKMQTEAEAIKLKKITQELNRIDSSLSADVSILRDYIEKASLEFSEAEKRYLKAEKEFVEAKLFLFEKMQRKEMLTEHLCAIIEQNENRKADKLVELMKQLEMEVIVDDYEISGMTPILPNLCVLNDESYHCCQTLKVPLGGANSPETKNNEANMRVPCKETGTDAEASHKVMNEKINQC